MRRGAPELVVGFLLALLLASYVVYTRRVVRDLRGEAMRSSLTYARVFRALNDTSVCAEDPALLLLDLSRLFVAQGVPVVVTDLQGRPTGTQANVPEGVLKSDSLLRAYVRELDLELVELDGAQCRSGGASNVRGQRHGVQPSQASLADCGDVGRETRSQ